MKCIGDYHTHSEYSHGKGNLRKNIAVAVDKGFKEYAVTDHGPAAWNFIRLGVRNAEELLEIKNKIIDLQSELPQIKLYSGVEANIINKKGNLDVPRDVLEQLDIIAVGFHLLINPFTSNSFKDIILNNRLIYKFFSNKRDEIRNLNTEIIIKTVQKYRVNFITHPGYGIDIDTYELARVCAERGTCLEINARHVEELEGFVRAAVKTDVKFIINSDAHSPEEVGDFTAALKMIRDLAIPQDRIVNLSKNTK